MQYPGKAPTTAAAINMAARYRAFGSDQVADENFQMVIGDPLSLVGFTRSTTILERPEQGFRARSETTTNVWSETDGAGGYVSAIVRRSRPSSAMRREQIDLSQKKR